MRYEWTDAYCLAKPGAQKDYKEEWQAERYLIGGKMFGMRGGDRDGKPILTVKLEPAFGALLRGRYAAIIPGYYMNKEHWNSMYLEEEVPEEVVREMLDESYRLVFSSLSKKAQREILGGADGTVEMPS